jgi:hypothetical protein
VGGVRCFDVGHGVTYERRGCWGDQVRVRCAAGVGWAVVMTSTSWAVKAALTYLGRASSAVASGSEIGTTRGKPSGNPLAACGRVGLLQQCQLRACGVGLLGYNRGAHPHRGDRLPGWLLVTVGTGLGSPRHTCPRGGEAARSSVCSCPRRSRGSGRCLWSGIQIAPFRASIVTGLGVSRSH